MNAKTTEGTLVSELLFQQSASQRKKYLVEINCFRRAKLDSAKLSQSSKDFIASAEYKEIIDPKNQSSVVPPAASSGHGKPEEPIKKELSASMNKVDALLAEVGKALPDNADHQLLKYLYSVDRLNVDLAKVKGLLKQSKVNLVVQSNSAVLVALNRYLGFEVVKAIIEAGASTNFLTTEGNLVSELLFK